MIDRSHALPVSKQAKALGIGRGSVYYLSRPTSAADLAIMRRMDELHLDFPFAGSRMLQDLLKAEGVDIGRLHVATLMKRMGIEAIYRKPNTSKPAPGHKIYPYLLRKTKVVRSDQVWAMDITYIPMARGFVYLAAVVDWFSRRVLSHRVSITMEADFCVEALEEALAKHGRPEIFNTDQGSQFTSAAFTDVLLKAGVAISMDGKGVVTGIWACGLASGSLAKGMAKISYKGYRFPPEIIQQAIWLYLRFTLSFRDVEDLLAERGIIVSYETVRRWVNHFGPMIAADLRKRRPKPHATWHLDEVYLKIDGRMVYLWRAVDAADYDEAARV